MIAIPNEYFKSVKDLMNENALNKSEKIKALQNWKSSCEHFEASSDEGMPGDSPTPIVEVMDALRQLEA